MSLTENPRAVVGDNRAPDYAQRIAEEVREQYRETGKRVQALISRANQLPDIIDDTSMGPWAKLIKDARDEAKLIDAFREAEKQPHYRASQAIDGVFFPWMELLVRRTRTSKPGLADTLQRDLDDYQQRKLAAERERRRAEADELVRQERERRDAEERAQRAADEARLAADRARKAEAIAAKGAAATQAEADAAAAKTEADLAAVRAEDARIATLAKPADIVRTRVDEGPLVTMGTEPYAVIEDDTALDRNALWPFITMAAKEQALRAWARSTGFNTQMPGARVGRRPKSVVR